MEKALKRKRITLYRRFDNVASPPHLFNLQVRLAKRIIEAELQIRLGGNKDTWGYHLDRLYALGDAMVWALLSQFTIRQLGRYESVRTSLIGQEGDYLQTMARYRSRAQTSIYLFADLTRCITIGDIIEVVGDDEIRIIEIKTSIPERPTAEQMLSGRNGRQFSKLFGSPNS
ncbi:hypothetical protein [Mucilaginibacter psychrotolerans]|uniref:Uncharacterized protein n=1 Tax=Mucilaginibacter psychrotolerans TaxID=1524096 RepID=A0A4Y8SFL4_9SPHI|nr:hypothetical protein [Mucilaginibacter psychrotolerans]TFF37708.1 hypothetical protein E2R66_11105 [Mucilaginibacter psychrotolerans]